jgi:WD40 repeat protein
MRRFRFRIGSLLILIVFLGVGFAALREATDLWDSIVLTLAIGVLLVSLLLAIHRKVERRAFWVAFALFGWVYLGLIAIPSIESRLLTTRALAYLDSRIPRSIVITSGTTGTGNIDPIALTVRSVAFSTDGSVMASSDNSGNVRVWSSATVRRLWSANGTTENFVRIGHSLFAVLLAWLGGSLSRRLDLRSRRADPLPPSVEASGVE